MPAETIFSSKLGTRPQSRYEIHVSEYPTYPPVFRAVDFVTWDDEPSSLWHIEGFGETVTDAVSDLLAQMAEAVARQPRADFAIVQKNTVEPPEPIYRPYDDPDDHTS